jgi:hypothetical protein
MGVNVLSAYGKLAAGVELPNLQASMLQGLPAGSPKAGGIMSPVYGRAQEMLGLAPAQAAAFMASIGGAAGGMDNTLAVSLLAAEQQGANAGGLASILGNQRLMLGVKGGAAEINSAITAGMKGANVGGYANVLASLSQQEAGAGYRTDRFGVQRDMLGMARGNLAYGMGAFQRTQGISRGAAGQLGSMFGGVAESVLMMDAMMQTGGDLVKAQQMLETQDITGMKQALERQGLSGDVLTMSMVGGGMRVLDTQRIAKGSVQTADDKLNYSDVAGTESLKASKFLSEREGDRLRKFYEPSAYKVFEQKEKLDVKLEANVIDKVVGLSSSMDSLTETVTELVEVLDQIIYDQRDSLISDIRALTSGAGGMFNFLSASFTVKILQMLGQ